MAVVVDYAWGRPSIAALKASGAVAVCRYLAWPSQATAGKLLTPLEVAYLTTGGLAVVSNWEQAGSWAEYSRGAPQGAAHAAQADLQHRACGPPDRPIYFSCDFDAYAAQLGAVGDYYRGVASVIGLDRTGAYGSYRVIRYLFDHGLIRWGWQTYAWSGGQWDGRAQLRQTRNGVPIDGVDCDLNESMTADFGQWGTGVTDMEQADQLAHPTPNAPGRTIGAVFTDLDALRDYLIGADTVAHGPVPGDASWPKPDSPLAKLLGLPAQLAAVALDAKAAASLPPVVTMTPEDQTAIIAGVVAGLAPLIPTAEQNAIATLDEQHRRDAA